jgi:hypothetical protein
MTRHLLNLLTLLSLVLCVAVVALWVRSYWAQDTLMVMRGARLTNVGSVGGSFFISLHASPFPLPRRVIVHASDPGMTRGDFAQNLIGFMAAEDVPEGTLGFVMFPQWTVVAACVAMPGTRLARRRRRKRREAHGLCPRCGYDLRGNVSGVCPECGEGAGRGRHA